jgi:hypothetical protein
VNHSLNLEKTRKYQVVARLAKLRVKETSEIVAVRLFELCEIRREDGTESGLRPLRLREDVG